MSVAAMLAKMVLVQRVHWLWRRERDRELWAHELGWITTQGAAVG